MSFQLPTATALPAEVQLGKEKPQGAFCLRTRYALSANSANSWSASTLVSLPLQTGTPGTFTDVKQGTINCTLQITNTNPYVDYLNFGPCGAIIFFDEMRVYSSGTPIEENLRYSESVDLLMNQCGWQAKPYHVFRRNQWRAANGRAGDKHINFIKPSMVDTQGVPLNGRTPFMDNNSGVYQPPAMAFGYATDNLGATGGTVVNSNVVQDWGYKSPGIATFTLKADNVTAYGGNIFGMDGGTFCDAGFTLASGPSFYNGASGSNGSTDALFSGRTPSHVTLFSGSYTGTNVKWAKQDALVFKNTQVGRPAPTSAQLVVAPWLPAAQYVPSQWPDYQPFTLCGDLEDDEVDVFLGKTKVSEYMKYLANVRSLPIGVSGNVAAAGYQANSDKLTAGVAASSSFTEYRVSMPFLSGVYGILADKMFPDLLIGANNIRIEFKLASNQKAFWLTMDPCRRVPGTVRDFAPFTGAASGATRGPVRSTDAGFAGFSGAAAATYGAWGCENAGVFLGTDASLAVNTSSVVDDGLAGSGIVVGSQMYTTDSALGLDFVPTQHNSLASTNDVTDRAQFANTTSLNGAASKQGFHLSPFSNLPKPQYVPVQEPYAYKSSATATVVYCNENQACYGTYLPAAVAQVRRCQKDTRLKVTDNFDYAGTTSFAIKDLQYIGEQVQLDDISTSAIIAQAASAEIVVWTRGYRSFEANCDQNEQQNIILPIQIGQATAMYLVFRPSSILNSPDYYSNSFVCPFQGLGFTNISTGSAPIDSPAGVPDVGGRYTLTSSLDSSSIGAFSYQLFSGTKQYPLQPIQTVSELLVEREKSTHSLHNWNWGSTENMALSHFAVSPAGAASTGLSFDPFLDLGYFTTHVPTAALDDQTITQNPYFSYAEAASASNGVIVAKPRVRGIRCPPAVSTGSSYQGVLNRFVSPIGTFFLGWDFESWTNHEDLMRTGKYLGQEQLSVRMTGCKLMSAALQNLPSVNSTQAVPLPISCTAIVPHVVKLSFIPGGHVLSYY